MKKLLYILSSVLITFLLGCSIKKMSTFGKCEFKLDQVNQIELAGIKINPYGNTNLSMIDGLKIADALSRKQLPFSIDLDLNSHNPTGSEAKMNKFDWKIKIKDETLVEGSSNQTIIIPSQSNASFNFKTTSDAYSLLSKYSLEELKALGKNAFDSNGNPKEIKLYIKPYLSIGKINIPYPGFIEVSKLYKTN
jgi:hypothetical protein